MLILARKALLVTLQALFVALKAPIHAKKRTLIIGSKTLIDTHHRSSAPIGAHLRQESTLRRDESALFLAPKALINARTGALHRL